MLFVQKFGGSSLADAQRLRHVARLCLERRQMEQELVIVVSAMGDTTDILSSKALELSQCPPLREMDALMTTGEQQCAALLVMSLEELGLKAVSLTGWQAGIRTDGAYGNAKITEIETARVLRELDAGNVVVVAGFQGIAENGDITTLGRGGSDTTAVALAAYLHADLCQIFTDVDGVYDRDPRKFPDAVRFGRISYEKMLRLIENGAQVLHDRSVEMARDHGIPVEVLSAFTGAPGTIVG